MCMKGKIQQSTEEFVLLNLKCIFNINIKFDECYLTIGCALLLLFGLFYY